MKWEAPGLRPMNSPDVACGSIPVKLCNFGSSAGDCKSGGSAGDTDVGGCAEGNSAPNSSYCNGGGGFDNP